MMLNKALEIGHPETMLDTLTHHSELVYHPHPDLIKKYLDHFLTKDYESLKKFFAAIKGNYLMIKPVGLHAAILDKAFENGDKKVVIDAYLDAFNYDQFNESHLVKVFESQVYEDAIDHGLIQHLNKQAEKKGVNNSANIKI